MNLLLQNVQMYKEKKLVKTDVLIENGRISKTNLNIEAKGVQVIQAEGCVLSPGFADLHVHLRQPGFEYKESINSGTKAAAAGGYTLVCSMPNLAPVPDCLQNLAPQLKAIEKDAKIRVLPYGAITADEKGLCLADIDVLAKFVAGFSDDGRGVQSEEMMRCAMRQVAAQNSIIFAHCEVESLLPKQAVCVQQNSKFAKQNGFAGHSNLSEAAEVERNIRLAEETGCRLHICHISAEESIAHVRVAKAKGLPVTCEVTPHNLLLSCDDISEDDGRFKMNPPLRMPKDVKAAVQGFIEGTIDAIASDHAPHSKEEKAGGFAKALNGVVGLETAFAVLYTKLVKTGVLTLEKLIYRMAVAPRKILEVPTANFIKGELANFTLIDLKAKRLVNPQKFASMGRSTPFANMELQGWPVLTAYDGEIVFDEIIKSSATR